MPDPETKEKKVRFSDLFAGDIESIRGDSNSRIERLISLVQRFIQKTNSILEKLRLEHEVILKNISKQHNTSLSELKNQMDSVFVDKAIEKIKNEHGERMRLADEKTASLESIKGDPGRPGKPGFRGPAGSKDTGNEIIEKINASPESTKIKREQIEGLEKELVFLRGRGIISASNPGSITVLDATGAINDSNKIFTFALKPKMVVVNGAAYREDKG